MKTLKKFLAALMVAVSVESAAEEVTQVKIPLTIDWDSDNTSFNYPISQNTVVTVIGAGTRTEGVFGPKLKGYGKIQTSGASVNITATDGQDPFTALVVGDMIQVVTVGLKVPDVRNAVEGGQTVWLRVVTRADADNITVNQAVDLTGGVTFYWRRGYIGTTGGTGWVPVRDLDYAAFEVWLSGTTDGAGHNVRVECRDDVPGIDDSSATVVYPSSTNAAAAVQCGAGALAAADQSCVYTDALVAAGLGRILFKVDAQPWFECRVGVRISVADDGGDVAPETHRVEFIGTKGGSH